MIVKCNGKKCASEFQDKTYGKGMRVANETAKKHGNCTVCETENKVK